MVTLIGMAATPTANHIEPIDRDSGIITLAARLIRFGRTLGTKAGDYLHAVGELTDKMGPSGLPSA